MTQGSTTTIVFINQSINRNNMVNSINPIRIGHTNVSNNKIVSKIIKKKVPKDKFNGMF